MTDRINDIPAPAPPDERPAAAPVEEMIRFCPECGHLGDIRSGYVACCPDWSQARIVPKRFAELCAETFKLCVNQPYPQAAPSPADERAAFEAWVRPDSVQQKRDASGEYADPGMAAAWSGWQARATSATKTADERSALPQIPDLVKSMAWLTMCLRTELSRLDDATHKALDEVEAQLCCVRALTNGAIDYEAMGAARATSANDTGAVGAKHPFGVWFSARLDEGTLNVHDRKCAEFVYESLTADRSPAPAEAVAIYQTNFIRDQWRDVDSAEYERTKTLRPDLARIVYAAPQPPAQAAALATRDAGTTEGDLAVLTQAADFLEQKHSRIAAIALRALLNGVKQ